MWNDDVEYNRYENLDGIEDKIIYYLLSENNKNEWQKKAVHEIWRLLYYNNAECLNRKTSWYEHLLHHHRTDR